MISRDDILSCLKRHDVFSTMDQVADDLIALIDEWPNWFPASPRDIERGEELFGGGYTWTLQGEDGPKRRRRLPCNRSKRILRSGSFPSVGRAVDRGWLSTCDRWGVLGHRSIRSAWR
jgi:hypothetical protein